MPSFQPIGSTAGGKPATLHETPAEPSIGFGFGKTPDEAYSDACARHSELPHIEVMYAGILGPRIDALQFGNRILDIGKASWDDNVTVEGLSPAAAEEALAIWSMTCMVDGQPAVAVEVKGAAATRLKTIFQNKGKPWLIVAGLR